MTERCIYCGMEIEDKGVVRKIDGEEIKFCSQHCAVMFEGLEKKGRMKAAIMGERAEIISRLEEERGTKVITLIHRREPWEDKDERYISIEDTEHVLMRIRQTPGDKDVDLILHTPGGLVLAAEMIAMAVKNHPAKVSVIVPFYAMSGGTLIALAADEIIMEKDSVLGPVDPQLGGVPAGALISLLGKKPPESISDDNIMLSEEARKGILRVQKLVEWLLRDKMEKEKAKKLAEFLTGGYTTHDTPIVFEVAKGFDLNVKQGIPERVYELFRTFEFGACSRPQYARY
ncbi:ClpP class periplasmic serine protease [Candidatus Methanoperedens nitroreducens]|uniref:ClpP class periplasmic serine protease n=1 Tax=Candidatus Methanoperedens nitratireducens TaxID=1392998 RepID=A0A062VCQ9_9EURY|nr:ATP-dependent Clp protease proteolytic subunit [Candidatus Methanoperedens nitroreducens]KCZ73040.1 ClpP class periplasmic serine protease [Candidatus Methanoperedens nitroreducens]MDJ1423015.1 ATP-dependent Clp protease proteolytic subunit [Candidatus Methanoperedens sp.]